MKPQTLTLQNEQWLMRRLREQGSGVLDSGITSAEERRERVRKAITELGLMQIVAGRGQDGKPMLYPAAFERLYSVPFASANAEKTSASALSQPL